MQAAMLDCVDDRTSNPIPLINTKSHPHESRDPQMAKSSINPGCEVGNKEEGIVASPKSMESVSYQILTTT